MKQVNFIPPESTPEKAAATRIFEADRAKNQHPLDRMFCHPESYGIPVVNTTFAKTVEEAVKVAE